MQTVFLQGLPSDPNGLWPSASVGISLWSTCQNEFLVMQNQREGYLKAKDELPISTTATRTVGMWACGGGKSVQCSQNQQVSAHSLKNCSQTRDRALEILALLECLEYIVSSLPLS